LGIAPKIHYPNLYDHRYLYFSETDGKGRCVSNLVRDCVAAILRDHDSKIFLDSAWLNICRQTDNPSTQGFLAENSLMSHLKANGTVVGDKMTPTLHVVFGKDGIAGVLVEQPGSCVQYIPNVFNYKAIDLLLRLVPTAKQGKVKIVPIQVTMQSPTQHASSIGKFFSERQAWKGSATKVEWHFVWITRGGHIPTLQKVKTAKSQSIVCKANKKDGLPTFTEHFVSFGDVCQALKFLDDV
jgi:hypothetical protein